MQSLNRHILILGRLFLVFFIVATSGFSIARTYCTMSDEETCSMENAKDDDQDMSNSCTCHGAPRAAKGVALASTGTCMFTIVAGGLQTDPTTLEKVSNGRQFVVTFMLPAVMPVRVNNQVLDKPLSLFHSAESDVSPISVEKYVLNATFLI